jgi:hypothetical protein
VKLLLDADNEHEKQLPNVVFEIKMKKSSYQRYQLMKRSNQSFFTCLLFELKTE